jgi:hypothetical protein
LEPADDYIPRRLIWFVLVVRSDVPDTKLAISAVKMSTTVNELTRLTRERRDRG